MTDNSEQFPDIYNYMPYVKAGDLVFFSGIIASNADGADPATHYRIAFEALDAALASAGLTKAHLIDLTTFHVRYPEHMAEFMQAKHDYLCEVKTCWTAIGVAALGTPETLFEIKAIARI